MRICSDFCSHLRNGPLFYERIPTVDCIRFDVLSHHRTCSYDTALADCNSDNISVPYPIHTSSLSQPFKRGPDLCSSYDVYWLKACWCTNFTEIMISLPTNATRLANITLSPISASHSIENTCNVKVVTVIMPFFAHM
jgi:hypothetical protein